MRTITLAWLLWATAAVLLAARGAAGQPTTRPPPPAGGDDDPRQAALAEQAVAIGGADAAARATAGGATRVEVIHNADPVFSLHVPPGFYRQPDNDKFLFWLTTSDPAKGVPDAFVAVQRMGGTIGPEPLRPPTGIAPDLKVATAPWNGFDLEATTRRVTMFGQTLVVCVVQIPTRGEAIQLMVGVPPAKAATLDDLTAKFLAGLDGESSWTSVSAGEQAGFLSAGIAGLIGVAGGLAYLIWRARKRRGQPVAQVATLARARSASHDAAPFRNGLVAAVATFASLICVGCLLIGTGPSIITNLDVRAISLFSGATQMSLVVGVITLGVSAFFARRRRKAEPASPPPPGAGPPPAPSYHALDNIVDDRE